MCVNHLPEIGIRRAFVVEPLTFSHVNKIVSDVEAIKVRLLVITLTPFVLELPVSTAVVLEPLSSRLVSGGSSAVNSSLLPLFNTQANAFEFPIAEAHVTFSPRHADCLSHVIEVSLSVLMNGTINE